MEEQFRFQEHGRYDYQKLLFWYSRRQEGLLRFLDDKPTRQQILERNGSAHAIVVSNMADGSLCYDLDLDRLSKEFGLTQESLSTTRTLQADFDEKWPADRSRRGDIIYFAGSMYLDESILDAELRRDEHFAPHHPRLDYAARQGWPVLCIRSVVPPIPGYSESSLHLITLPTGWLMPKPEAITKLTYEARLPSDLFSNPQIL